MLGHSTSRTATPERQPEPAAPPPMRGAEISACYHQERVGGDWYDFIQVGPRVLFALLDVAGDYASSLPVLAAVQQTFRSQAPALFSAPEFNEADNLSELSLQMNLAILRAAQAPRCTPAFLCSYHQDFGTAWYVCAGHVAPLVKDAAGIAELGATGLPLGLFAHSVQDACIHALEPGACLLAVSRGVLEAAPRRRLGLRVLGLNGEEFGMERLKQSLAEAPAAGAQQLCSRVLQNAYAYSGRDSAGGKPPHNDMTTLALVRTDRPDA